MTGSRSPAFEPTVTSKSLIHRIRARDQAAWNRLVDLYGPLIWSWCRTSGLQPSDADDVCQNVLASVHRGVVTFEHSGSFRGWLWRITRNAIVSHLRSAKQQGRGRGGSDFAMQISQVPEAVEEESSATANSSLLAKALELIRPEFEPSTWTAFQEMVLEHRPAREIAEELGWCGKSERDAATGAKRVRQAKFRVLMRLREEFSEIVDFS